MRKVFVLAPDEDWVCDRFVSEWYAAEHVDIINVTTPHDADVLWLLAGWCWQHIPLSLLRTREVCVTVHHIDHAKFNISEFAARDAFVDWYHVPCDATAGALSSYTRKPIFVQPFWVDGTKWRALDRVACRQLVCGATLASKYIVGSFQRDTEGFDLKTPKLAKGPDVFIDVVTSLRDDGVDVGVVLAGWRRQYVISRLQELGVNFVYFERCSLDVMNVLYNALDLYVIGSRVEGGPQALFECALTRTPIVSTRVGAAELILGHDSAALFDIVNSGHYENFYERHISTIDVEMNATRVEQFKIPQGMVQFDSFLGKM